MPEIHPLIDPIIGNEYLAVGMPGFGFSRAGNRSNDTVFQPYLLEYAGQFLPVKAILASHFADKFTDVFTVGQWGSSMTGPGTKQQCKAKDG
jgi:hypothetical protein